MRYMLGPVVHAYILLWYEKWLVSELLIGLHFTFGYPEYILVFSPDIKSHLKHLEILFQTERD